MVVVRKQLQFQERPLLNALTVYRSRGNYLQRIELFDKAIQAYNEALRWYPDDVQSLLGRSIARAKATYYKGALEDAVRATELEPENLSALIIRARQAYETCSFERSLVLAHRGQLLRKLPPDFAECARHAEETVRDCTDKRAQKVLRAAIHLMKSDELQKESKDDLTPIVIEHRCRMAKNAAYSNEVPYMTRIEKQKREQIYRLMASKYLGTMAHDKYFLTRLSKDERLASANKTGSLKLQELAAKALTDIENRQAVLRERQPMYATSPGTSAANERLRKTRREQRKQTRSQNITDANRLLTAANDMLKAHDVHKCVELAEFAMRQITLKPTHLLPNKERFLQELYNTVALAFLDQKCVSKTMSEADREKKAFLLLGIALSREPSRESIRRIKSMVPVTDIKHRLRRLERSLLLAERASERCYSLHELCRLYVEMKQAQKARYYALKCQKEARASNQIVWLLNATFLLSRCHVMQNNRPEARVTLLDGATMARSFGYNDVAAFFDTCANVSNEGEIICSGETVSKREKEMVGLMQDDDMKSAAQHLFRRMSTVPAARRFSVMPGAQPQDAQAQAFKRRASIMPRSQSPVKHYKQHHPLGFQDFDI